MNGSFRIGSSKRDIPRWSRSLSSSGRSIIFRGSQNASATLGEIREARTGFLFPVGSPIAATTNRAMSPFEAPRTLRAGGPHPDPRSVRPSCSKATSPRGSPTPGLCRRHEASIRCTRPRNSAEAFSHGTPRGIESSAVPFQISSAFPKSSSRSAPLYSCLSATIESHVLDQTFFSERHDRVTLNEGAPGIQGLGGNGKRGTTSRSLDPRPGEPGVAPGDVHLGDIEPEVEDPKLAPHDQGRGLFTRCSGRKEENRRQARKEKVYKRRRGSHRRTAAAELTPRQIQGATPTSQTRRCNQQKDKEMHENRNHQGHEVKGRNHQKRVHQYKCRGKTPKMGCLKIMKNPVHASPVAPQRESRPHRTSPATS
jgi:hypothetical protein